LVGQSTGQSDGQSDGQSVGQLAGQSAGQLAAGGCSASSTSCHQSLSCTSKLLSLTTGRSGPTTVAVDGRTCQPNDGKQASLQLCLTFVS